MMYCSKCGKEMPEGATFCPSCGFSVNGQPAPAPAPAPIVKVETPESQKSAAFRAAQIGNIVAFGALVFISVFVYIYLNTQAFLMALASLALTSSIAGFVVALISMKSIKIYGAANKAVEILVNIFFYINIGMMLALLIIF